jgi:hypothetical protein
VAEGRQDISHIFEDWQHEGTQRVQARIIAGDDGTNKIQLRLEMGILQMEMRGRPDGTKPENFESLLDFHRHRLLHYRMIHGNESGFRIQHEDCLALQREALQYYHRRISLMELGEFDLAERDASHNLQILDILKEHAEERDDWLASEQYRAFILSHRTSARALKEAHSGEFDEAVRVIEEGIEEIKRVLRDYGHEELIERSLELQSLENMRVQILSSKPPTIKERLERELQKAVDGEQYERAAKLRDRLRKIQ